ncbi:MAG TPA: Co2+/Mg2+ efflux protein ApaG [Polyangia bacterium]|jgi:ApaG protein|nr:Co2+/Mg2+ efflux protein ApaG [Polyangia bacterium]
MSSALTRGILVTVRSEYIPARSSAQAKQYAFAYTVTIANQGRVTAQLKSRHWIISDAFGAVQEVRGEGVIGAQPVLRPGEAFEYTSWCVIATPSGTMRGTYQMVTSDGDRFDAEVAPFALAPPQLLN